MKKLFSAVGVGSLILVSVCVFCMDAENIMAQDAEKSEIVIKWAFGANMVIDGQRKLVSIKEDCVLKTGDQFKFMVEVIKPCFVYLFYLDSSGAFYRLFPYKDNQFEADYAPFVKYYIPQEDMVFTLDDKKGPEKIYLLVAASPLVELENKFALYEAADEGKKEALSKDLVSTIKDIRKKYLKFTTEAKRPVPIGGLLRGMKKNEKVKLTDLQKIATTISSKTFYGRTFTIDHQ